MFRIKADKNEALTELFNNSSLDWHKFHISKLNEIIFYELEEKDLDKSEGEDK